MTMATKEAGKQRQWALLNSEGKVTDILPFNPLGDEEHIKAHVGHEEKKLVHEITGRDDIKRGMIHDGRQFIDDPTPPLPQYVALDVRRFRAIAWGALSMSDVTIVRCAESGIPVPQEWVEYRKELRRCAFGERDDTLRVPPRPKKPEGLIE
jgi:hypothetical protein